MSRNFKHRKAVRIVTLAAAIVLASGPILTSIAEAAQPQLLLPVEGKVGEQFGPRANPKSWEQDFHKGEDFLAPIGTPVKAAGGGTVTEAEKLKGYGNIIAIDHGNGLVTRYAHLSRMNVGVGDAITAGQIIGTVGTADGGDPQLHFEVLQNDEPVNPVDFLPTTSQ